MSDDHRCVFPEPDGWLKIVPDEYWPWFDTNHPMNAPALVPTMEDFNRMSRQLWENDKIRGTIQSCSGVAALFGKNLSP